MPDPTNVKALVFDVFGTVVDWRAGVAREAEAILSPKGVTLDWPAFADRWRAGYQPAMEEVRSGRRPFVLLDQLHREMLGPVLAHFDVSGLSEAEITTLSHAWRKLDPWPDAVVGLTRLAARFPIAPLSNANLALMEAMSARAGLPWTRILGAEPAQAYKPDPRVYDSAPRLLGIAPAECMMVACHPSDLDAAAARGLRTAYVHRPMERGNPTRALRPESGRYDLQVDSFTELADVLGA